ncbi:MAG: GNAT family N-acetyltransferase [Paracoccaceae bacterium]
MTFRIRPAVMSDIGAIDQMLQRSYPRLLKADYPPSVLVTALPLMTKAQPKLIMSCTYFVAEDDQGLLLGAGGWTADIPGRLRERQEGRANIRHFVTDISALRRGVAGALMDHCIETASVFGATWLHCMSTRTAVPFYAARGFETLGPIDVPMGPGVVFPALEMRRDL